MVTNSFLTLSGRYFVQSLGNGWAYEVEDVASGESIFVQDSDANQLREHTNDFDNETAIDDYFVS
jgi:hypothetical protein